MSSCPVCERTFNDSLSNEFVIHVNACLDSQEQKLIPKNFHIEDEGKLHPLMKKQKERQRAADCVVCGKAKATAAHIKKCGKENGVNTVQLVQLVGDSEATNQNLNNIKLKDSSLNQSKIVHDLFTENSSQQAKVKQSINTNSSVNESAQNDYSKLNFIPAIHSSGLKEADCTIVLDKVGDNLTKQRNQTKLKVIRKSKSRKKLLNDSIENSILHPIKRKNTVKIKRNPLVKVNLDDIIVQNFKDEYIFERQLPISWKLASLNYDSEMYTVDGFQEFCESFLFKSKMNGFEIGSETK